MKVEGWWAETQAGEAGRSEHVEGLACKLGSWQDYNQGEVSEAYFRYKIWKDSKISVIRINNILVQYFK